MIPATEALERLRLGNNRFLSNACERVHTSTAAKRDDLLAGQSPFAIVIGCSDSRVPVEIIFDEGFGDLFVIRNAGNTIAASEMGSVEFAADHFGTGLVVVLGHSNCGAVKATLDEIRNPSSNLSPNIQSIVDRIRPSAEPLLETDLKDHPTDLVCRAVRENILVSANQLRRESPILLDLIQNHGLQVVGAEYSLETGRVDFFDGIPLSK